MIYIAYCGTMILMFYNTWNFMFPDGFLPLEMGRWWHCYFMWVMDSKCIIVSMCLECWPISCYCVDYSLLSWLLVALLDSLYADGLRLGSFAYKGSYWETRKVSMLNWTICFVMCSFFIIIIVSSFLCIIFWWITYSYKMHIDYSPWWDLLC